MIWWQGRWIGAYNLVLHLLLGVIFHYVFLQGLRIRHWGCNLSAHCTLLFVTHLLVIVIPLIICSLRLSRRRLPSHSHGVQLIHQWTHKVEVWRRRSVILALGQCSLQFLLRGCLWCNLLYNRHSRYTCWICQCWCCRDLCWLLICNWRGYWSLLQSLGLFGLHLLYLSLRLLRYRLGCHHLIWRRGRRCWNS